jgi:hypothetical protein
MPPAPFLILPFNLAFYPSLQSPNNRDVLSSFKGLSSLLSLDISLRARENTLKCGLSDLSLPPALRELSLKVNAIYMPSNVVWG